MSDVTVMVTGAAGFLGSHLCASLINDGHRVIGIDDESNGKLRLDSEFIDSHLFTFLKHDIRDPILVDNIHQIYHLACPASPVHYQRDPVRTITTNVIGTVNVLDVARRCRSRVLLASTSEVYGDPLQHPQSESYLGNVDSLGIRACYDEGKRCAETLFMDYHRQYGTDVAIARIFNTYGPGMRLDDGRVISNFMVQALRQEPITLFGDGLQTRSFCYVSDLIEGLRKLMDAPNHEIGPFNLGNSQEITVYSLAYRILKITGSQSPVMYLPLPAGDPVRRQPDISKALLKLNWKPCILVDEGIALTIPWFRQLVTDPVTSKIGKLEHAINKE